MQMPRIFITIFDFPISMYIDAWADQLAVLLKIKHWPGLNFQMVIPFARFWWTSKRNEDVNIG